MLSSSPTILFNSRRHNDTHETQSSTSHNNLNDDKQAMENLLAESKRLVKSVKSLFPFTNYSRGFIRKRST